MDVAEFVREFYRMCDNYDLCRGCPMDGICVPCTEAVHRIWIYASVGDYGSGYESFGYRVECMCGYAWKAIGWHKTKQDAIDEWNRRTE